MRDRGNLLMMSYVMRAAICDAAELMRLKYGIAVAGMHGKTTSLIAAGADPETGCNPATTLL